MKFINNFLLVIFVILLTSCSSSPVNVNFKSSNYLNPDQQQKSLPVVVRLFQLNTAAAFMRANFWELWQQPQQALGSSLLAQKSITIAPGINHQITLQRKKTAKYLGVMAVFRKPVGGQWRTIVQLGHSEILSSINVTVVLHASQVAIAKTTHKF